MSDEATEQPRPGRRSRSARHRAPAPDPLDDYPVGPDDAGNAVMAAYALAVRGWRWVTDRLGRRP